MNIQITRDDLIKALKAKRAEAAKKDAEAAKAHAAAEKQWAKDIRDLCRQTAKITDYAELVKAVCRGGHWGRSTSIEPSGWPERPTCDVLQTLAYDRALERLAVDSRKKFVLNDQGMSRDYFRLITRDFTDRAETVCD